MKTIHKSRSDAEIAAPASQAPEQICMILGAHFQNLPIRSYQFDGEQVVHGETVLTHHPAETASEREAGDSRRRDDAARRRQAVHLCFAIEIGPRGAALSARRSCL